MTERYQFLKYILFYSNYAYSPVIPVGLVNKYTPECRTCENSENIYFFIENLSHIPSNNRINV